MLPITRIDRLFPELFSYDWKVDPMLGTPFSRYVQEHDDRWEAEFDVPGFNKDSLEVFIENGQIVVRGKTKTRSIHKTLPALPREVDYSRIESRCKDGVLTICIYKSENSLPKKIAIADD